MTYTRQVRLEKWVEGELEGEALIARKPIALTTAATRSWNSYGSRRLTRRDSFPNLP